jgi:hypothetical protein
VEYQALPEIAQMHMLEQVMRMVLYAAILCLALTIGCIAGLCACELWQRRTSRCRPPETLDQKEKVAAIWRYSTR